MMRGTTILTTLALSLALAPACWAQSKELPTQTTTIAGTIETIDHNTRAMNIKEANGTFVAVVAPKSVKRFDQLKVGDRVKATYNNNVMVRVKPPGEAAVDTAEAVDTKSEPTYGSRSIVRTMTASVVAVDKGASSITFEGTNGWKYSGRVVDPAVFDQVKAGDKVDITWNTDLTVELN